MKLGYTHFDNTQQPDASYIRVTLTPQDMFRPTRNFPPPGKQVLPVLRFREQKKEPDKPDFVSWPTIQAWIEKLAPNGFEYVFVGSEMNDASQWAGTPEQYFNLFKSVQEEWKKHDPQTLVCDGGLQGTALVKDKVKPWLDLWQWTDRVNFHHFQDIASIEKITSYIRSKTDKPLVCSAAGVKKSVGKKVTMTAKLLELQRLGVELAIWFSGDGDDANTNLWPLPRYLKEFNDAYQAVG